MSQTFSYKDLTDGMSLCDTEEEEFKVKFSKGPICPFCVVTIRRQGTSDKDGDHCGSSDEV